MRRLRRGTRRAADSAATRSEDYAAAIRYDAPYQLCADAAAAMPQVAEMPDMPRRRTAAV